MTTRAKIILLVAGLIGVLSAFAQVGPHVSAPAMLPPMPPALLIDPRSKVVRLSKGPAALVLPTEVYRVPTVPTMHFKYPANIILTNYCWHLQCSCDMRTWQDFPPYASVPNMPDGKTLSIVDSEKKDFFRMVGIPK